MKRPAETNSCRSRLLLELRHPPELPVARHRREQPRRLGVRGHVALAEDRRALRVEPGREQHRREVEGRARAASAGSYSTVIECRSTMQKNASPLLLRRRRTGGSRRSSCRASCARSAGCRRRRAVSSRRSSSSFVYRKRLGAHHLDWSDGRHRRTRAARSSWARAPPPIRWTRSCTSRGGRLRRARHARPRGDRDRRDRRA